MIEKIKQLKDALNGSLLIPTDEKYDETRAIWNGMIDNKPAVIVRCNNVNDIIKAVNFGRESNMIVSIKGGGHNVAGKSVCNDGLMIDLSLMKSIQMNLENKTVIVEPGVTLGDLDEATQPYGLSVPVGIASTTGISGLTLGGGIGYICRTYGLTIDNLISAKVVTANGDLVSASESENSDLFWAIRGGGGNFGIVCSFEFKMYNVGPEVMTAQRFYAIEDGMDVLNFYEKYTREAPEELSCYLFCLTVPPMEPFPENQYGKTALLMVACHSGDIETGKTAIKPLEEFGSPFISIITPMPFVNLQKNFDHLFVKGNRYYWKSHYMKELSVKALETLFNEIQPILGPFTGIGFEPLGGAVSRRKAEDTAFPAREANYVLGIWTGWENPEEDDTIINWARNLHDKMSPFSTEGVYSNYLSHDDDHMIKKAFGVNYERLKEIKNKYDPHNFFSLNQNIKTHE
jgi:FAD/FMN-containing dehydrogenase